MEYRRFSMATIQRFRQYTSNWAVGTIFNIRHHADRKTDSWETCRRGVRAAQRFDSDARPGTHGVASSILTLQRASDDRTVDGA